MSNSDNDMKHKWFWLIVVPIFVLVAGTVIASLLLGETSISTPTPKALSEKTTDEELGPQIDHSDLKVTCDDPATGLGRAEILPIGRFIPTAPGALTTFAHCPPGSSIQYNALAVDDKITKVERTCTISSSDITSLFAEQQVDDPLTHYASTQTIDLQPDCRIDFAIQDTEGVNVGLSIKSSLPATAAPTTATQPQAVIDLGLWEYKGNRPPMPAPAQQGEIIFAHGDITDTGPCSVRTFVSGEPIGGLGQGTFRLLKIIGPPEYIEQRKAEAHQQAANGIESNTGRSAEEICPTYRI